MGEFDRRPACALLKRALIEQARALGYHHLVAKVFADNAASLASNRRCGFELVGVQREVGIKQGKRQDVAILQLILGEGGDS